jgi:hypothetical protein
MMKKAIPGAICALLAATLACSIFVGGPSYPEGGAPVPTETSQSLQDQITQALASASDSGEVSLDLTEGQLTSFLQSRVAQEQHPVITDPRVYLRNGEMKVFGHAESGIFNANISMTLEASVDAEGQPHIGVTQTYFGPIKAPKALNDAMSSFVEEAFTGWLGPVATGFRLAHITIGDGVMTVSGRIK